MGYPRTRTRRGITAPPLARTQTSTYYDGTVVGPYVVGGSSPLYETEDMYDIVTPGYQSLVNRGVIINNPMTHVRTSSTHVECSFVDTYNTRTSGAFNDTQAHAGVCVPRQKEGIVHPIIALTCDDKSGGAINRAFADVNEGTAQLLVDIAELSKTWSMLNNPLTRAVQQVRRTRKILTGKSLRAMKARGTRIWGEISRIPDTASSVYLEWRYGWTPLLRSIDDTCRAIAEAQNSTKRRFTGRGFADDSASDRKVAVSWWNPLGCSTGGVKNEAITEGTKSVKWRAGVLAEGYLSPQHLIGVSFADVPSAAWELVPYSFVVDWFVGVGDWLSAHRPTPGFRYLASWLTVLEETDVLYDHYYHAGSCSVGTGTSLKSYSRTQGHSSLETHRWSKTRRVGVSPTLLPQTDLDYRSLTHLVDGVALAYQRFGKP